MSAIKQFLPEPLTSDDCATLIVLASKVPGLSVVITTDDDEKTFITWYYNGRDVFAPVQRRLKFTTATEFLVEYIEFGDGSSYTNLQLVGNLSEVVGFIVGRMITASLRPFEDGTRKALDT